MFDNFVLKKVPTNWEKEGYPSLKPLASWFDDLVQRVEFMKNWIEKDYLPSYWVSPFYFPQGFMTAVLQTYARETKIPIDELVFQTHVRENMGAEITDIPKTGVNIHGMILEGCGWSSKKMLLSESERKVLFLDMPAIW